MASFSVQIDAFLEKTQLRADLVLRKLAFDGYRGLLLRSPVGNPEIWKSRRASPGYVGGRFRGEWRIGLNRADTQSGGVRSTAKTGEAPTSTEEAQALRGIGEARFGDSIHITQSLPYAPPIEHEGHSSQAKDGVLRPTFEELKAKLDEAIRTAIEEGGAA